MASEKLVNSYYNINMGRMEYPIIQCKVEDARYLPKRAHESDAGGDLVSSIDYDLQPGEQKMFDTGVAVKIPKGFAGFVFNRSSQGKQGISIPHSVGIIDSDYRGNIKIILKNNSGLPYSITAMETRIGQLVIMPVMLVNFVDVWNDTERGAGGFGSTGI